MDLARAIIGYNILGFIVIWPNFCHAVSWFNLFKPKEHKFRPSPFKLQQWLKITFQRPKLKLISNEMFEE